jgi:N-acyl-D-aspartate/D-glutamate deacylase
MTEFSVLVKDVTIVDGTGKDPYKGSIGIRGDKIVDIGEVKGDAEFVVDGKKLTAMPGFIDSHSHGDMGVQKFPQCESYILQGVTTMIAGQCGMSLAPVGDMVTLAGVAGDFIEDIEPYKYYPSKTVFPRDKVNKLLKEKFGITINWNSMAEWFDEVEKQKISMNMATLVGHVTVRRTVLEDDFERPSTENEIEQMSELIRKSLDEGAYGMSVGLDYDPDTFATKEEIITHCKILTEYGAIFVPHSRRTGRRRNIAAGHRQHDKIDGILEVIDMCRKSGVKMNIAHLFTGWSISPQGYPHIFEEANRKATLEVIDNAIKEGLDISFDVLPSSQLETFGSGQYLCGSFAPWIREKGSRAEFAKWLTVKDYRQEIKEAIRSGKWFIRVAYNPNTNPRWAENYTILKHKNKNVENKTIADISLEREKDAFDVWFDLIVEDPDSLVGQLFVYPSGSPDINAPYHKIFWEHPTASLGIDTGVHDYKYESPKPVSFKPMVNTYSAFPSFFEKFVKKDETFTLVEAVHKTSTQAAIRHGIEGRGMIKKGYFGDLVVVDMNKLKVMGTPLEPKVPPKGIEYVFVNGVLVAEKGKHTGKRPGYILRKEWKK